MPVVDTPQAIFTVDLTWPLAYCVSVSILYFLFISLGGSG